MCPLVEHLLQRDFSAPPLAWRALAVGAGSVRRNSMLVSRCSSSAKESFGVGFSVEVQVHLAHRRARTPAISSFKNRFDAHADNGLPV